MENSVQVDLTQIGPVEGLTIDLNQFDKKEIVIEKVEVVQVPSKFTPKIEGTEDRQPQWVLKVSGEVLETIGEGEEKIEFRASELFNLVQDKEGKLTGFPIGDGSNLMKFMKDLKIEDPDKLENLEKVIEVIKGKTSMVKAYEKNEKTYLKFRY